MQTCIEIPLLFFQSWRVLCRGLSELMINVTCFQDKFFLRMETVFKLMMNLFVKFQLVITNYHAKFHWNCIVFHWIKWDFMFLAFVVNNEIFMFSILICIGFFYFTTSYVVLSEYSSGLIKILVINSNGSNFVDLAGKTVENDVFCSETYFFVTMATMMSKTLT